MELLKPLILQVLTPQCYDEFFVDFNFFHGEFRLVGKPAKQCSG